jgi:hypothetical protein
MQTWRVLAGVMVVLKDDEGNNVVVASTADSMGDW